MTTEWPSTLLQRIQRREAKILFVTTDDRSRLVCHRFVEVGFDVDQQTLEEFFESKGCRSKAHRPNATTKGAIDRCEPQAHVVIFSWPSVHSTHLPDCNELSFDGQQIHDTGENPDKLSLPDVARFELRRTQIIQAMRQSQFFVMLCDPCPGFVEGVVKSAFEDAGLRSGSEIFLGYAPKGVGSNNPRGQTADQSNELRSVTHGPGLLPFVVGGDGPEARDLMSALYAAVEPLTVPMSSVTAAEAVNMTETVLRTVNDTFMGQIKSLIEDRQSKD